MSDIGKEWEKIRRQAWERQLRGHLSHGENPEEQPQKEKAVEERQKEETT